MNFKRFGMSVVHLAVLFALIFLFPGIAQANALPTPVNPICRPLRVECFPLPGSPMRKQLIREKMRRSRFEVPEGKILKLTKNDNKVYFARKPNGIGKDCPSFNAREVKKTLDDK